MYFAVKVSPVKEKKTIPSGRNAGVISRSKVAHFGNFWKIRSQGVSKRLPERSQDSLETLAKPFVHPEASRAILVDVI